MEPVPASPLCTRLYSNISPLFTCKAIRILLRLRELSQIAPISYDRRGPSVKLLVWPAAGGRAHSHSGLVVQRLISSPLTAKRDGSKGKCVAKVKGLVLNT